MQKHIFFRRSYSFRFCVTSRIISKFDNIAFRQYNHHKLSGVRGCEEYEKQNFIDVDIVRYY